MITRKVRKLISPAVRILLLGMMLILPVLAFGAQSTPAYAVAPCTVDYNIVNQWNNGFQANITITDRKSVV